MPKGSAAFFFRSCKMLRIPQSYIDELLEGADMVFTGEGQLGPS